MKNIEILAPAGDMKKLKTAVLYGADAVYLAGNSYGMRAFSANFNDKELEAAVVFCHLNNVKVYVTVNIIAHNADLEGLVAYFLFLKSIEVDAVIIADMGIMKVLKDNVPNLPFHISTQFSTTNYQTVQYLAEQGAERIILPRELSLEEIREIRSNVETEIEVFVHGAMCMGYSGRCMISFHTIGRDANRGACAQPCRFKYQLKSAMLGEQEIFVEEDKRGSYFFNAKDLCLIEHIPELVQSGVNSLKIEGRMKSISYLATTVNCYRRALDSYLEKGTSYQFDETWKSELSKTGNRSFTTFRFLDEHNNDTQMITKSKARVDYDIAAEVKEIIDKEFMVLEVKSAFEGNSEMEIVIPGKRIIEVKFRQIKDVLGREVLRTKPNQIVLVKYFKSVVPGTIIRVKKC